LVAAACWPIEQAAALQQVQIEIAVAVHVEQRGAASHDLRQKKRSPVTGSVHESRCRRGLAMSSNHGESEAPSRPAAALST